MTEALNDPAPRNEIKFIYSPALPPMQPEVSVPTPECPHPHLWHCFDGLATELEVLELLYALIRTLKPDVVIETGTYVGIGTLFIASALKANGRGTVHTAEISPENIRAAAIRFSDAGFRDNDYIAYYHMSGLELIQSLTAPVDFAFLDSDVERRDEETLALLPKLRNGGLVAVHDTSTYHAQHGGPREPVRRIAVEFGLQRLQLDCPRGLTLLRK